MLLACIVTYIVHLVLSESKVQLRFVFCRKPKPIDPEILRSMKVYHNVGYAPNPGNLRRNQIPYILKQEGTTKGKSNIPESPLGRGKEWIGAR